MRNDDPGEIRLIIPAIPYVKKHPEAPTGEQCDARARLPDWQEMRAFACWYPQMGGYTSKAVVCFWPDDTAPCFEAFVWHDGAFPFDEDDGRSPAHIHHCDANQFTRFGEWVLSLPGKSDP